MGNSGGNSSLVQDFDASPSPGGRVLLPFGAGFLLPSGPLCILVVALFSPFLSDLFVFLPEQFSSFNGLDGPIPSAFGIGPRNWQSAPLGWGVQWGPQMLLGDWAGVVLVGFLWKSDGK